MGRQSGDCDICGAPRIAKGLCRKHYDRLRAGLPLEGDVPRRKADSGEAHHEAKLTAENVRELRELHARGETLRDLGEKFGVSNVSIYNAVTRKTWGHVD